MNSRVGRCTSSIHRIHKLLGGEVTQLNSQKFTEFMNSWVGRWPSSIHKIHGFHGIHESLGGEVTQLNSRNSWIMVWGGNPAQFTEITDFTEFINPWVGGNPAQFTEFTEFMNPWVGGNPSQFTEFTEFMNYWVGWMGRLRDMDIYGNGLYDSHMTKWDLK